MSILNQGRNEIRFNNSDGKCLLENWVEEVNSKPSTSGGKMLLSLEDEIAFGYRQVKEYDTIPDSKGESSAKLFRDGHAGILTTDFDANAEKATTFRVSYKPPEHPGVRLMGKKEELMRQMYMEQVVQDVFKDDINPPQPEPTDYRSMTMADYNIPGFKHVPPAPTKNHNYRTEQPVTFWSEHKDRITGVTSVKTRDSPFRRNDAFSQPIDEYFDDTQPYDQENYPKM